MSKAWSKATEEQRANHRRACKAAGAWRRMVNFVTEVCEKTEKIGIDGLDFLFLFHMLEQNKKLPLEDDQNAVVRDLLKQKVKPSEIYQTIFGEAW
ncbi:MAG: hypothetical protein NTV58_14510 [Deltaproteobacteria bacterium]|nr:hypothetical protein [Deltaproteobacteria bacterium]